MKSPFLFLLALQGGLLLVGGGGMLWLGLPPARDAGGAGLWALVLLLALQGLEALFRRLFPASFREAGALHRDLALALLVAVGVLTIVFSIVGDLFESLLKRQANVKDSGTLFPGHGGLLDRLDSVFAAMPVFAAGKAMIDLLLPA